MLACDRASAESSVTMVPCNYRLLVVIVLVVVLVAQRQALAAVHKNQDLWYSLYFQSTHCGYTHISTAPDQWNGKSADRADSVTVTRLTVLGATVEQQITSHSWSDKKSGAPYYQTFKIESGGSLLTVSATFTSAGITAKLLSGGQTTTKVIPIPHGEKIVSGDTEGLDSDGPLKVGQTETDLEFNPVTLALDKQVSKVLSVGVPVKDARDGLVHSTAKVYISDPQGDATDYQTADATPILVLLPAGFVMFSTDEKDAVSSDSSQVAYAVDPAAPKSSAAPYQPSSDLAVATSVNPTGLKISDERTLSSLTVKLSVKGQTPRIITETAVPVPPVQTDEISALTNPTTGAYLASDAYITVNDPDIKSTAAMIIGSETNSYKAAKLIHDWVYANMSPVGTLGLPRSASDILANKQGVCRDYAVLYAALARAAGIPTKINAGLVGFEGRFYYHAWASSYLGSQAGWIQVDATMPTMFVDASHIALGSGNANVLFTLSDIIGNAQVETLTLRNSL